MIVDGKVVSIHYRITGSEGEELDRTEEGIPFRYVHGIREIAPGLAKALEGLKPGDVFKMTLPPAFAYGDGDESLRIDMERSQFPAGTELRTGESFRAVDSDGKTFLFEIMSIDDDAIHVDGNHPFCGKTLTYEVQVIAVRDATSEERDSGEVRVS